MARRRRLDRVGLLIGGALAGFILTALFLYLYVNAARNRVVEERVRVALGLPEAAFQLEDVEPDGSLRIVLRDVAFLDQAGDTIVSAPSARARLLAGTMAGSGPIVFDQGEVLRPNLRLMQDRGGEWNVFQIFAVEAGGRPVRGAGAASEGEAANRPLVFRNLRIIDGRARVATPSTAPTGAARARFASGGTPERVRWAGRWVSVHYVNDLDVTLGMVRVGGAGGWRVEIERASARVTNPDTRINAFAGWFEDRGDGIIRFDVNTFRTPYSTLAAEGSIRTGEAPLYDVRVRAAPLDLRDLAGMGLAVPREGTAAFNLDVQTLPRGRTRWTVTDARIAVLDSRASGRLTAVTGPPGTEPVFSDTRLVLDPVRLVDLETLGFVERLPVTGELRGTVASVDEVGASGGALRLDLATTLSPRTTEDVPPSTVALRGLVRFGGEAGVRFAGLRVEAEPLHLATLRGMVRDPASAARLKGTLRGGATLTGSLRSFRIEGGDLAYRVGDAPETRLAGLSGTVSLDPGLRYSISARAQPLALATLTELFPALPFRAATLSGPIRLSGSDSEANFDVDLNGAAGAVAARGTLAFGGAVPRFDVSGRLEAFRPGAVVTARTPVEGPLTGTFAARGSTEDFRFDVNLFQPDQGRFVLGGTVRRPGGGPAQLDVAGRVENFQLGLVLGQPSLLPGRVTGPVRVSGGGRQPYRFDVDLRNQAGAALDLEGWYQPGAVPRYAVSGVVAGLDASALPLLGILPRTRLTGAVSVDGRGTTLETFVGRIDLNLAAGSTIGGLPLQAGIARVSSDGQVLRVDTLLFAVRGARLEARGALGITRPAEVPLTFSLDAPNLAALRPIIPGADTLQVAGSVVASGTVGGTVRTPTFAARGEARGFRWGRYAAGSLTFDARGVKEARGWTASARLEGSELEAGPQRLQRLTAEFNATPERASFGFSARRDPQTDLAAAGILELEPGSLRPTGAILDNLTLRLAGTEWTLAQRARIGWTGARGVEVEDLLLRRTGPGGGFIAADGTIPPRGDADFRLQVQGVELAEARRLLPRLPDAQGRLFLDATLHGSVNDPRLAIDARVDSLRFGGAVADSVHVVANYAAGRMDVAAGVRVGAREVVNARATVPMRLALGGTVPEFAIVQTEPLTATIRADSVPLGLVAAAFPAYVEDAAGVMRAQVEVRGTPAEPTVSGSATLENGALTVVPLGARWERINGRLSLSGDTIRVDSVTARSSESGRAFVNGTVRLGEPGPTLDLAISLDDFKVADKPDLAELQADARVALRGPIPGAELTGWVRLEDGVIYIPEFGEEAEADIVNVEVGQLGADTVTAPTGGMALLAALTPRNLQVAIGGGVWLQSADARIQIQGDNLTIDRPPGSEVPLIYGDVEAVRGRYTFEVGGLFRREFEIVEGRVQFFGTPDFNPALDITAEHEVRGADGGEPITVVINLTGTLQNPRVELSSDTRPPLPESELAQLLVFGRRFEDLSGLADEFTRGAFIQEAIGNLLFGELEEELVQAGILDYLRVRTRTAAAATGAAGGSAFGLEFLGPITVEAGKEVVTNVFLSVLLVDVLSDRLQWGAALEWEISRTLTLRAAYEPVRRDPLLRELLDVQRQATVDVRARWEYGQPKPKVEADIGPRRRRDPDEPRPGVPAPPPGEPGAPPPPPPPKDDDEE